MDIPGADGVFELVNGYVAIEEGCSLTFDGGKICIIDNGSLDTTVLPSHTDVWLIRTKGSDGISFNPSAYNDEYLVEDLLSDLPAMTRHRMPAAEIIDADTSGCATLKGELNVYTFHGAQLSDNLPSGGIYIANSSDVPVIAVPLVAAARQANSELAGITVAATYGGGQFADQ